MVHEVPGMQVRLNWGFKIKLDALVWMEKPDYDYPQLGEIFLESYLCPPNGDTSTDSVVQCSQDIVKGFINRLLRSETSVVRHKYKTAMIMIDELLRKELFFKSSANTPDELAWSIFEALVDKCLPNQSFQGIAARLLTSFLQ